jgi:hypothetical protein
MSMTVQTLPAPKESYSPLQSGSSFSLKGVLKVLLLVSGFFQSGITPVSADQHIAKLPEYHTTSNDICKFALPFYPTLMTNTKYLHKVKEAQDACFKSEDEMHLAKYNLGRNLASPLGALGPMSDEEYIELTKQMEVENLQGIALMYESNYLGIVYPENGQTLDQCYSHFIKYENPDSRHYEIDGCYYFTSGTLMCPDRETFENLMIRATGKV